MNRTLRLAIIGLGGICLAGCANDNPNNMPSAQGSTARAAGERIGATDNLPLDVSASFHRDFPNAVITNVTPSSAETGQPIYRVTFIENGQPGGETYFADGTRLPRSTPGVGQGNLGTGTRGTGTGTGTGTVTGTGTGGTTTGGTGVGSGSTGSGTGTVGTGSGAGTGTGANAPNTGNGTGTRVDVPSKPERP